MEITFIFPSNFQACLSCSVVSQFNKIHLYIYIYIYKSVYTYTYFQWETIYEFRILKGIQGILQLIIKLCFLSGACLRASFITTVSLEGEKGEAQRY